MDTGRQTAIGPRVVTAPHLGAHRHRGVTHRWRDRQVMATEQKREQGQPTAVHTQPSDTQLQVAENTHTQGFLVPLFPSPSLRVPHPRCHPIPGSRTFTDKALRPHSPCPEPALSSPLQAPGCWAGPGRE